MKDGFIRKTFFESPLYTKKLEKENLEETGTGLRQTLTYADCQKDNLPNWLSGNSFYDGVSGITRGFDYYLFMGRESVLCRIALTRTRFTGGEFFGPRDETYQRVVIISSQPADKEIPKELLDTLNTLDFSEVDPVTDEFLKKHYLEKYYLAS